MDQQHRVGHKTGSGQPASAQDMAIDRKERLRRLALETVDLSKDPYMFRNHVGKIECRLCLTLHLNESSYLTHTQGRKHQTNLARRAQKEKLEQGVFPPTAPARIPHPAPIERVVRIGRPGYRVTKMRDPEKNQFALCFEINYKDIALGKRPRHRFMSAWEQKVEPPDSSFQYVVFAADPYEVIAFRIPSLEIDRSEGRCIHVWNQETKTYTLQFYLKNREFKPLPALSSKPKQFLPIGVWF
eukprot:Gregarina_sp_Poly_1__6285@NODE_3337_length_1172_cov_92_053394_g2113_i0_p1_GENE_NODE_3337_length_1172_cov_92_053394_g2113_i0NODE_3337_length_1172_cov_92_053394_g2113_i0_p1_ORF_typecomplete_len242_score22_82SF3A2/PF16835_5/6_9e36CactinC_cactus/PF09732_9/0_0023zfU1/PF06220_12/0_14zfmet/PF12874_7/0_25_NODE_3337_length_1172_cov_92_053394_g2113_i04101135